VSRLRSLRVLKIQKQSSDLDSNRGSVLRFIFSAILGSSSLKLREKLKLRDTFESGTFESLRVSLIFDEDEDIYTRI